MMTYFHDGCHEIRRPPATSPSACDVIGSMYALQFLIHNSTSVLVLVFNWVYCIDAREHHVRGNRGVRWPPPRKFTWGETWYFDPQIFGKKYFLVRRSVDSQPNHQNCCHQLSDFKAKMHQIRLRLGLCPTPRWGAYSDPTEPLAGFKAAPIGVRARGLGRLQPPRLGQNHYFLGKS